MDDKAVDRGPRRGAPLLVFVHIPKTAGTTLTTILHLNEPGPGTRHGGNVFKGGGGVKQGVTFEALLKNDNGELDRARIVTGHFPFGIRDHLPRDRDVRFFTLLREPADRTLSHFFQVRERDWGSDGPNKLGLMPLPPEATIEDAVEGGYLVDNLHTRMLSGQAAPFGEVDAAMLEQAKHNLSHEFACFGLTERFDESLVLARQRLGLRSILYMPARGATSRRARSRSSGRVNISRPRGDDVPEELRRGAERCNRYDIELYRYAQQLFDDAPERKDVEFKIELAALHAAQADGELELDVPPPDGFEGSEQAWRMLLKARAESLRSELELAELGALANKLRQREREAVELLTLIQTGGRKVPGRDAETALRVIGVLAPAQAKALANRKAARTAAPSQKGRQRPATKRERGGARGPTGQARADRAAGKARDRRPRDPRGG
jgi:Sulfotransferase family